MSDLDERIAATPAPRVTEGDIEAQIRQVAYHRLTPVLTVCTIVLANGFVVTGESACASPENYDQDIGEELARAAAVNKIWTLEAYLLKTTLHDFETNGNEGNIYFDRVREWLEAREQVKMFAQNNCEQASVNLSYVGEAIGPDKEWQEREIRHRALDHAVVCANNDRSGSARKTANIIADAEAYADYLRGNK